MKLSEAKFKEMVSVNFARWQKVKGVLADSGVDAADCSYLCQRLMYLIVSSNSDDLIRLRKGETILEEYGIANEKSEQVMQDVLTALSS